MDYAEVCEPKVVWDARVELAACVHQRRSVNTRRAPGAGAGGKRAPA